MNEPVDTTAARASVAPLQQARPLAAGLTAVLPVFRRWTPSALRATVIFNLIDGVLTLLVVGLGLAVERNPLMRATLSEGPLLFVVAKVGMVAAGVAVLWRYRQRPLAAVGSIVVCAAYSALMLYHLASLVALAHFFASA